MRAAVEYEKRSAGKNEHAAAGLRHRACKAGRAIIGSYGIAEAGRVKHHKLLLSQRKSKPAPR
jgi:hypothetical protein